MKKAVRSRNVCLRVHGSNGMEWYLMDLEKMKNMEKLKKKRNSSGVVCLVDPLVSSGPINDFPITCPSMVPDVYIFGPPIIDISIPCASTATAFYLFGAQDELTCSKRVLKFDATKPKDGFVDAGRLPHFTCRGLATAYSFKGKIYYFGGFPKAKDPHCLAHPQDDQPEEANKYCFTDCFDPESQTWTCITSPIQENGHHLRWCWDRINPIAYDENRLLLGPFTTAEKRGELSYWLYNVQLDSWNLWSNNNVPMPLFSTKCIPVKVDNTLYYRLESRKINEYGDICAFDLISGLGYRGPVKGKTVQKIESVNVDNGISTTLYHLGGNDFCFFTALLQFPCPTFSISSIYCTKVRVVKRHYDTYHTGDRYLDVTLLSTLSIPIVDTAYEIVDATPVDEIFVKTLLPDYTDKDDDGSSGILAQVGKWVSGLR